MSFLHSKFIHITLWILVYLSLLLLILDCSLFWVDFDKGKELFTEKNSRSWGRQTYPLPTPQNPPTNLVPRTLRKSKVSLPSAGFMTAALFNPIKAYGEHVTLFARGSPFPCDLGFPLLFLAPAVPEASGQRRTELFRVFAIGIHIIHPRCLFGMSQSKQSSFRSDFHLWTFLLIVQIRRSPLPFPVISLVKY